MTDREKKIRDAAYRLWQEAGQPDGQGDAHWLEAERMVRSSEDEQAPAQKPKRTAKAEAPLAAAEKKPGQSMSPDKKAAAAASAVAKAPLETDGKSARGKTPASIAEEPPVSAAGPAGAVAVKRLAKSDGGKSNPDKTRPDLTPAKIAKAKGAEKPAKPSRSGPKR